MAGRPAGPGGAMLALAICLRAAVAAAQSPDPSYAGTDRVTIGGEVTATASPPDSSAYFNQTDYDHDALRTVRARLLGEWHLAPSMALLGELRVENTDSIEAAALYLRWRPWAARGFDIQIGRIPPVVGAFARHAYGRDNLVIGTPLAYQYLLALRQDALPANADDLLRMRARGWRPAYALGAQTEASGIPLSSATHWDTGVEADWQSGPVELAGAVTRGAPAAPVVHAARDGLEWSARGALTPAPGLTIGASAARGHWIDSRLLDALPAAAGRDSAQSLVGADFEFGRGRTLIRAEWLRSAFDIPAVGAPYISSPLIASAGFLEGRYRWRPRWQVAARVDRMTFSDIQGVLEAGGVPTPWEAPVSRVEATLGFRAARTVELRIGWQEDWRHGGRIERDGYPALQVICWF